MKAPSSPQSQIGWDVFATMHSDEHWPELNDTAGCEKPIVCGRLSYKFVAEASTECYCCGQGYKMSTDFPFGANEPMAKKTGTKKPAAKPATRGEKKKVRGPRRLPKLQGTITRHTQRRRRKKLPTQSRQPTTMSIKRLRKKAARERRTSGERRGKAPVAAHAARWIKPSISSRTLAAWFTPRA